MDFNSDLINTYNETPNSETIEALREVERLKGDPNKKTYNSFNEILEEMEKEGYSN